VDTLSFVDCHSHVVPSGDDGVQSVQEGIALCREAARRGTAILFGTPHVSPLVTLTVERERDVRAAYERVRAQSGLELRLGFELTPMQSLLDEDPARYALAGTSHVLMEVPFTGSAELLFALGEHVEQAGLTPVIAHPERTEAAHADPTLPATLAGRGWPLQVNATSLLGRHGPAIRVLAWSLVEEGLASIVASDGHRATRPPYLDEAFAAVSERVGERAVSLFDGSALGLASPKPESSRVASKAV
jgi:protein-tyrosine phosphatase